MIGGDETVPKEADRVCLCVVFSHPFIANIPLLRKIYGERFSCIRFIVPLTRSDDEDVLTVYRGSFAHQASATDQRDALEELACSHYVFVQDDVLLSPFLDESNILQQLGIQSAAEGFIGAIEPVPRDVGRWGYQAGSLTRMFFPRNALSGTGVDSLATVLAELPPFEEAAARAAKYGISPTTVFEYTSETLALWRTRGNFVFFDKADLEAEARFGEQALDLLFRSKPPAQLTFPYPLAEAGPNSDFFVVPRAAFASYAHIAGVLAAAGLFVEMAAVTALMLSCEHVRTSGGFDATLYWSPTALMPAAALDFLEHEVSLLIHPLKLSQVKDEAEFLGRLTRMRERMLASGGLDKAVVLAIEPDFDPAGYLALNPDVAESGDSPFRHFRLHGRAEQRRWRAD